MRNSRNLIIAFLCVLLYPTGLFCQTDKEQILEARIASNLSLKSYDLENVLFYLTDDALTTTGSGVLLSGKKALADYILAGGDSKMYWVRHSKEILVNEKTGLAWENGIWNGYDPIKGDAPIVGGNYSAMWTKASGEWKIKSQLFVTLE